MTTQEEEPIEEERRAGADTTAMNAMYGDEQSPETSNNNLSQGMDSILASREQVNGTTAKVTLDKASMKEMNLTRMQAEKSLSGGDLKAALIALINA